MSPHLATTLDQIAAALTDDYQTARTIWRRVDCWESHSVHAVLRDLVALGRAEMTRKPITGQSGQWVNMFRRPAQPVDALDQPLSQPAQFGSTRLDPGSSQGGR